MRENNWEHVIFYPTGVGKKHKLNLLEAIYRLTNRSKKGFGLLIIIGWKKEWSKDYALITDVQQDIFRYRSNQLFNRSTRRVAKIIKKTKYFDGAILVNRRGLFYASGIYLTHLQPRLLLEHLGEKFEGDFSRTLGFREKVHARHLVAITASWQLKGTTIYTVSEETKTIRVYEEGRIIYSSIPEEIWQG